MHAAVLTAFLFALTGICATQASRLLGAARANSWRLLVALSLFTVWFLLWGEPWGESLTLWFFLAGGIGFGLGGFCMFQALRRIGSTLSLLVVESGATLFTLLLAWGFLGQSLAPSEGLWVVCILGGIFLGMTPGPLPSLSFQIVRTGVLLALLAAFFQSISFTLSRYAFTLLAEQDLSLHPLAAAHQRLLGGAAVALFLWVLVRQLRKPPTGNTTNKTVRQIPSSPLPAPLWVFLNALFGPVLGVSCLLWAISLVPNPGLVQAVAATATLLTIPPAMILEKARPGFRYYAGALLALTGVTGLLLG